MVTALYSDNPMFRQPYVPTHLYSDSRNLDPQGPLNKEPVFNPQISGIKSSQLYEVSSAISAPVYELTSTQHTVLYAIFLHAITVSDDCISTLKCCKPCVET